MVYGSDDTSQDNFILIAAILQLVKCYVLQQNVLPVTEGLEILWKIVSQHSLIYGLQKYMELKIYGIC